MGFLAKMKRIFFGKVNKIADELEEENIEVVVKETIKEMEADYRKVKEAVNQSITLKKKVARDYATAQDQIDHWKKRAQTALANDKEELAKKALEKKHGQERLAQQYREQLEKRKSAVKEHKERLGEIKERLTQAKQREEELIAEAKTARATKQINDSLSGLDNKSAAQDLTKLENKVDDLQAKAEASEEIYQEEKESDLASEFKELAKAKEEEAIEEELAALKTEFNS